MKIDIAKYAGIILQVLIIVGLFYLYQRLEANEKSNKEYWEGSKGKKFKTDTVVVEVDYSKLPKPQFKYPVPPAVVYTYPDTPPAEVYINFQDSLLEVIDSLQEKITVINTDYIKKYPDAAKILYGVFTGDSLTIDLLDISGGINRMQYGVNYERFHYQWVNGELRADKIPFNYFKRKFGMDAYANAGYDWMVSKPILGADLSLKWSKLRLYNQTWVTVESRPQFNVQSTLGFKIR